MPRRRTRLSKSFWLLPAGLAAGVVNGLLGCGGGMVVVFTLGALLPETREQGAGKNTARECAERTRDIFAMTVLAVLPMSVVSAFLYGSFGSLDLNRFLPYLAPALIGGLAGGFLLDRINTRWLKKLFALLILYSGIRILL